MNNSEPSVASEVSPALTLIDSIVGALKPTSTTFSVTLGSVTFEFRYLGDGDEWQVVGEQAKKNAETVAGRACPVELKPFRIESKESLTWCYLLANLSVGAKELLPLPDDADGTTERKVKDWGVQPAFEWMKLAKNAMPAFETIKAQVNEEITGNVRLAQMEAIKAGKAA